MVLDTAVTTLGVGTTISTRVDQARVLTRLCFPLMHIPNILYFSHNMIVAVQEDVIKTTIFAR